MYGKQENKQRNETSIQKRRHKIQSTFTHGADYVRWYGTLSLSWTIAKSPGIPHALLKAPLARVPLNPEDFRHMPFQVTQPRMPLYGANSLSHTAAWRHMHSTLTYTACYQLQPQHTVHSQQQKQEQEQTSEGTQCSTKTTAKSLEISHALLTVP